ncbi:cytochrome P450 [Gigaspora margarita]|uniref:Cytochrome P450 n=2 Tax=Gigaspora margarita TaxID=4874 RepID=A0A8H3XEU4_GIGMA|nr:cytochrome P450 [Gigaspora margarita]
MIEVLLGNIYIQSFIVGLILAAVFFKLSRRVKLNEPPLAYYRIPIIGHTWSFLTDCEKLILESREKYGETFSLYVFGQIMTIVGKETTHEVLKNDQVFDFREGLRMQVPLHLIFKQDMIIEKHVKITRDFIPGKLKHLISRIQKNISKALDLYIGECEEPKVIHEPRKAISDIFAIPIVNIIVEECYDNEDILETFKGLTFSIANLFRIPPVLSFIHPWLHQQFISIPLRFGWNPISKYRKVFISHIKPVIEKRLYDKKRLGDAWVAPVDVLQSYLDDPEVTPDLNPNNINYDYTVYAICNFIFVSMASTLEFASRPLYDLIERKQRYWQELYQEAQEINKQRNRNELTLDDISKMVKLDSFVKESLRFSTSIVGLPHKCISKSYYTFANGYQVPSGRIVNLNFSDTNNDEELQGQNPTEFHAYRHIKHNSPATKLERNFLIFGGGKHACPGRSLAINEIKVFLHQILLKYDVRTDIEEIRPKRKYLGPFPVPINVDLVFENRKEIVKN